MTSEQFRTFLAWVITLVLGVGVVTAAELIPDEQEWLAAVGGGLIGIGLVVAVGRLVR